MTSPYAPSTPATSTPAASTSSSDPDQIRREIERTQEALSTDVDALSEKVTPSRIAQRRVARVRGTASRWRDKVTGSDPFPGSNSAAGSYGGGPSVSDRARHVAGSASDAVQSAASTVSDTASQAASTVHDAVQQAPGAVVRQTRGNPLAAGLIAFGAGWLVSSLLPASQREQELAEQAKQHASELGQPLADAAKEVAAELQEPAQQAVESVRATATDAGRTVAEQGQSAAQNVQDRAQDAAGAVRQSPPPR
jgi:hypothetical protein